jgi:hypothetical protein
MTFAEMYKIIVIAALSFILPLDAFSQQKLPSSTIRTVYVTPTSHYDLGFVDAPEAVRERAARHIDEVIRVAEHDPEFRWTIESVWQVDEWLKRQKKPTSVLPSDKQNIERLLRLIRSGQVELSTSWGSMHTDFMGAEELNRLCYDFATLKRSYGIDSQLAMMDDVPGHPTSIPSVLAGSGTRYLVTGANTFIGVATSLAPGKVPFYWESPDGSKVLTWISQGSRGGYVEGMTDFYLDPYSLDPYTDKRPFDMFNPTLAGKKTDLDVMEIGITELLNRYNAAGYKYDAVMAMYAHDFVEPTNVANLERAVRLWNSKHNEVKLKIATPTQFLKYIEAKYGSQIPTYRGEWSGLWSEAKTQSPRVSALARYVHDHAPAAESLWSAIAMTRQIPAPVGNFASLYELMFTYDEHSGAGNNGWPQLNSSRPLEEQNREYVHFMTSARDEVNTLLNKGMQLLAQPTRFDDIGSASKANLRNVLVFNPLSWRRSDVVTLKPPEANSRIVAIRDLSTGTPVGFDIDENGAAVFIARDVPPVGYADFEIVTLPGKAASTLKPVIGRTVQTKDFQIEIEPNGTVKSIRDLRANRELVNDRGALSFNQLLRVEGSDASKVIYPVTAQISVKRGLGMTRIEVRRMRSVFPVTDLTLYDGLGRVEIHNELDPNQMPFVGGNGNWNDSYYFAFPMDLSTSGLKVMRGGQKWFDRLPDDYLPDARHDAVTTQHMVAMTDGVHSELLAHRQAFHWVYPGFVATTVLPKGAPKQLPPMFTGKFPLPEATIYSRTVRTSNQADTHDLGVLNMSSVEPGLDGNYVYDYALAGEGIFDPVSAWHLGSEFNVPLLAEYTSAAAAPAKRSFFSVDQPNVEIVTVKPFADTVIRGEVSAAPLDSQPTRIFVMRLQEFAGRATTVHISLPVKVRSASLVSLTEDKELRPLTETEPITLSLGPYQTATVKFEIQ